MVTVAALATNRPPPSPAPPPPDPTPPGPPFALACWIVRLLIATLIAAGVTAGEPEKAATSSPRYVLAPSSTLLLPLIVTVLLTGGRSEESVIVARLAWMSIVVVDTPLSRSSGACRSEPAPESLLFETAHVVAIACPANAIDIPAHKPSAIRALPDLLTARLYAPRSSPRKTAKDPPTPPVRAGVFRSSRGRAGSRG